MSKQKMWDLPREEMKDKVIKLAESQSDEAAAYAFLQEYLERIDSKHSLRYLLDDVLRSIRPLGRESLSFILESDLYSCGALAENPALLPEHVEFLARWAVQGLREGIAEKKGERDRQARLLRALYINGRLQGGSGTTEELLGMVDDIAELEQDRKQQLRGYYPHHLSYILSVAEGLTREQLMRFAEPLLGTLSEDTLEKLISLEAADVDFWLLCLARVDSGKSEILEMIQQIPPARRDPDIRSLLKGWMSDMPDSRRSSMMQALLLDETTRAPECFRELAEDYPEAAADVLDDPEFQGMAYLKPLDLAPLLVSEHQEARLKGIAAQARLAQASPSKLGETQQSWRERYKSVSLPF